VEISPPPDPASAITFPLPSTIWVLGVPRMLHVAEETFLASTCA
jgi:hypothetical protein